MNALDVLCAQLTSDLFAIAKFLFKTYKHPISLLQASCLFPSSRGLPREFSVVHLSPFTAVSVDLRPRFSRSYWTMSATLLTVQLSVFIRLQIKLSSLLTMHPTYRSQHSAHLARCQ